MNPELLIFDLDGTLIDSRADLAAAVNHVRDAHGLHALPLDTVSGFIGDGAQKLVERSLSGTGIDAAQALNRFKTYYREHLTVHTCLYEGVTDGIPLLAQAGHRLALLTNKPGDPSRAILKHFGLAVHFDLMVGGGDLDVLKPEPGGLLHCLEASGMQAADAWMIGDHCTDLAVAENAGVKSAFVRYGFGEERGYQPDVYFASFSELVGYFV